MIPFAFLPSLGFPELAVISMIALLVFGNRLPSVMRSLGKSITEFKKGMHSIEDEASESTPPENATKSEATVKEA